MARAPASSSVRASSAVDVQLTDDEMWAIACHITMSSLVELGHNVLGYSFDEVDDVLTACNLNAEKAAMKLLGMWRCEQPPDMNLRKDLRDKLNKAAHREIFVRGLHIKNIAKNDEPTGDESVTPHDSVEDVTKHIYESLDLKSELDSVQKEATSPKIKCSDSLAINEDIKLELMDRPAKSQYTTASCEESDFISSDQSPKSHDSIVTYEETDRRSSDQSPKSHDPTEINEETDLKSSDQSPKSHDPIVSCEKTDTRSIDRSAKSPDSIERCEETDLRSEDQTVKSQGSTSRYEETYLSSSDKSHKYHDLIACRKETDPRSKDQLAKHPDSTKSFADTVLRSPSDQDRDVNDGSTVCKVPWSSREPISANGIDFVQGFGKPLSDDEVFHVAEDIESDAQIEALGVTLNFSNADINRYLATNQIFGRKTSQGSRMMMFDWRQSVKQLEQRASLKGALIKAGLVMIADQYFPEVKEIPCSVSSDLTDDYGETLRNLARDIETDDQMCALGSKLGFSQINLGRFVASNRIQGRITCKGNVDMLFEWRQKVMPSELPIRLKEALRQAGLVFLAEKHFPDILQPEEPSLDILSAKTTAIAFLRKHLVDYYKTVTCQIQRKPWDPEDFADMKNLFTNIVIYFLNKSTGMGMREVLPGSINDVLRVRVNGQLPKRVLMVAAAGRGKTCTVAKMAYDWSYQADSSPLNDIPLFFALKLRLADDDTSLGEAILSETLGNTHGVTPESLEGFIGRHEEDCALALDGYDEYKGKISAKHPKSSIRLAMSNKIYRRCRIIVTSRPYLEKDFQVSGLSRVYTKMEIEGFSQSQATTFIEKYFMSKSKPEEVGRLTEFLNGNGFSSTIISIPLFCMMICHLWEENLLNEVSSLTGLFDTIIQFLLAHSRSKDESFEIDPKAFFQNLGKLAFCGLRQADQKVVFEEADFHGIQEYEESGIKLGLLSKQTIPLRHIVDGKTSKTYVEFFHKMAQEYCASKFLESSPEDLEQFQESIRSSSTPLMYADVLRFLAGTGDNLLMSSINLILQIDDRVSKDIKHRLLLNCLCEARGDISKSKSNFPTFFDDGKICLRSLPLSAVIGLSRLPPKVREQITSVELMYCHLPAKPKQMLWLGLQSCTNLQEMNIWESSLPSPKMDKLPFIKHLTVGHLENTTQYASHIHAVPNIESLRVESSPNKDNLQEVLDFVMIGIEGTNGQLRSLVVSGCSGDVSDTCARYLMTSLKSGAPLLEKLELHNVRISGTSLTAIVIRLYSVPSMKEISFQYCGTHKGDQFEKYLDRTCMSTVDGKISVTLRHAYQESKTYWI